MALIAIPSLMLLLTLGAGMAYEIQCPADHPCSACMRCWEDDAQRQSGGCANPCVPPQFNNTKCPAYWELQAPHVATNFSLSDIPGYYYELAFHDLTQRPLCPAKPRCITSEKGVQTHSDGVTFVNDTWNLACFGHAYPQELLFNVTEHPGYLLGYVPVTKIPFLPKSVVAGLVFPDTVVDFKGGPDGWLLEFQCMEALGGVRFVGINFYSKSKTEAAFQEMYAAAKARGLGLWIDSKPWGLSRVDHTNCPQEPSPSLMVV